MDVHFGRRGFPRAHRAGYRKPSHASPPVLPALVPVGSLIKTTDGSLSFTVQGKPDPIGLAAILFGLTFCQAGVGSVDFARDLLHPRHGWQRVWPALLL